MEARTQHTGSSTASSSLALRAVSMPWAFSQQHPLDTAEFIREAEKRGVRLDAPALRELYRVGVLVPLVTVTTRPVRPPAPIDAHEPVRAGTRLAQLRYGRDTGRLRDLAIEPYRPRLRFDSARISDPRGWWNGHIYSWYQLLVLPVVEPLLLRACYYRRGKRLYPKLKEPWEPTKGDTERLRRIAAVLMALEARYLPNLDPEWVRLSGTNTEEWQEYRRTYNPEAVLTALGCSPKQISDDAEHLLFKAHNLDPVGRRWSYLMRRAPSDAWKELTGRARMAIDHRISSEILLRFYEDLAHRGVAEPLPEIPPLSWHPLHERLSYRPHTLDQDLASLGISPHPRVVLIVEGETEEYLIPRVWQALQLPNAPELMRVITLRGVKERIVKVGAFAAAPLVGELQGEYYDLIKPPTKLLVAVDPDPPYHTPEEVEARRTEVLDEIKLMLVAQGAEADPDDLGELVEIRTWSESCFEFEHFTDDELAKAILEVYRGYGAPDQAGLIKALSAHRANRQDIGKVWTNWRPPEVSKTALAKKLWPVLEAKIQDESAPHAPTIAKVVYEAYLEAQKFRYWNYVLRAAPRPGGGQSEVPWQLSTLSPEKAKE
jgi:hypothetical protein